MADEWRPPSGDPAVDRIARDAIAVALVHLAEDLPRLMKEPTPFLVALIMGLTKELRAARPDLPFGAGSGPTPIIRILDGGKS